MSPAAARSLVVASLLVLAGLLAWSASTGPEIVTPLPRPETAWAPQEGDEPQPSYAAPPAPVGEAETRLRQNEGVQWFSAVLTTTFLVLGGGAVLLVAKTVVERVSVDERPTPTSQGPPAPLVDEEQAAAHVALLRTGSPRNGIVACWVELEGVVTRAGTTPRPSETPTELATRVLADHDVPDPAVRALTDAYLEARFSGHEVTESDRSRAAEALGAIHAALLGRRT